MDRIITGVELGERKLRIAVARHRPGSTRMLAYSEAPSAGIENDAVVDARELADALVGISRSLRTTVDFPLENAVFVVPAGHLQYHPSMSVSCDAPTAANIRETARYLGSENVALMAGPLAESHGSLTDTERERGAAVLSIGERMSTITVMHDGQYLGTAKIGIGAQHFTNDLAIALDLPYPIAQAVMDQAATVSDTMGPTRAAVTVDGKDVDIDRVQMVTTLRDRADEFLALTETAIGRVAGSRELPGGVAIAGLPVLRDGLAQLGRSALSLPFYRATPRGIEGIPQAISGNTAWVPAVGTLAWAGAIADPLTHPLFQAEPNERSGSILSTWRRLAGRRERRREIARV